MSRRVGVVGRMLLLMLAVVLVVVAASPAGASPGRTGEAAGGVEAMFEGDPIDLAADWGGAEACLVWSEVGGVECFRTEVEMDARIAGLEKQLGMTEGGGARGSQCSGYLRLYDGVFYTGSVLYIRDRLQWINLGAYGFSNRTSSFKIGPCDSYLADYYWGGGSWYSTSATQAWDVAAIMAWGWSNRVSSLYIR